MDHDRPRIGWISHPNRNNLYGLGGNDTIDGNSGDDMVFGGAGTDVVRGDGGNDAYIWAIGDGNDTLNDTSTSLSEVDTLRLTDVGPSGVALIDTLRFADVTSSEVVLSRAAGGYNLSILVVPTGETIIITNRFNDPDSGYGVERIAFADSVTWTLDDIIDRTTVTGTSANQTLNGIGYDDNIYGLAGNDVLNGNAGDDLLVGGLGADTLNGGTGVDTASYRDASQGVKVDLAVTTAQTGNAGGEEVGDVLTNIEALEGSTFGDTLLGNDQSNDLWGLAGNDSLTGRDGYDRLFGGDGADTLDGGVGSDLLQGDAGSDFLDGNSGNDTLIGGTGADVFVFSALTNGEIDRITDFENGTDVIRLHGVAGTGAAGKFAALSINDVVGGAEVVNNGHAIILAGLSSSQVDQGDFVFV